MNEEDPKIFEKMSALNQHLVSNTNKSLSPV